MEQTIFAASSPVLVLAAHHDDEVLGCGGTIARLAAAGRPVTVAILGEGPVSRPDTDPDGAARVRSAQRAAAEQAAVVLGVRRAVFGDFPDNRFDTVPMLRLAQWVEGVVAKTGPGLVLTHFAGDLNVDHAATFRAALTALRPLAGSTVRGLYSFETPSATEWAAGALPRPFNPNVFVDIAGYLETKLRALEAYAEELREAPHPRSREGVLQLAGLRGNAAGVNAAEAFEAVRTVI
jgi:LmbE family N-acetylglucosaminyl deacetylase